MRSAVVLLGLLLGGGVLAQESDSFNLSEHTFNAGGSPQDGAVLTSTNFQLSLSAIGQGVTPAALASASFSLSGGFVGTYLRAEHPEQLRDLPFNRLLDGGSEWEYFQPVRPGDRITAVTLIVDVFDRAGRSGQMLFVITETRYTNQFGELVATQKSTSIKY